MNRDEKYKYEKKLWHFLREWRRKIGLAITTSTAVLDDLKKKYGFTEDDWHKAVRRQQHTGTHNMYENGIGYKKATQIDKDRDLMRSDRNDDAASMDEAP